MSGWHHHGDHDTCVYVVAGTVRLEFGPGGGQAVDAGPGDFLHIPRHVVHREVNPGSATSQEVVTRSGTGPPTVNVDGPAPPWSDLGGELQRQTWWSSGANRLRPRDANRVTEPLRLAVHLQPDLVELG
jgi:hypothetical protein